MPLPLPLPTATIRTQVSVPLRFADGYATDARVFTFDGLVDGQEHLAFELGDPTSPTTMNGHGPVPLVRPHSECLTGDVFGSQRCDCGAQLREAVERIAEAGGYLLYLRQEGRGIGLYAKLDAYALQDTGLDTYEANVALGHGEDERDYTVAAQMLDALGVSRVALLSNNPDKAAAAPPVRRDRRRTRADRRAPVGRPTPATWRRRCSGASTRSTSACRPTELAGGRRPYRDEGFEPNAVRKGSRKSFIGAIGAFGLGRRPFCQPQPEI